MGALVSVAVLGVTSFYTVLRFGGMHGWWLFAHMFGAGALTGVLPLLAIDLVRCKPLRTLTQQQTEAAVCPRFFWIPSVMFWSFCWPVSS